jgi:integrase
MPTGRPGKPPVLAAPEALQLLDSIDTESVVDLRDRALIALLAFTFARIGAALDMTVANVYWQHRRLRVRLHEKGSKGHSMPATIIWRLTCSTTSRVAGLASDREGPLFRTTFRRTGF